MIKSASSPFFFSGNKTFALCLLAALVLLLVQMYLNTGTLSGYAVTLGNPFVKEGYIVNYDYPHYECNYRSVMGENADEWKWGWVLRRQLFFVLAFPFFKIAGFYLGGLIAAFIITLVSFYFFIRFVYKNIGLRPAYVAMALLATYPGIMYWIGSPFAQVMIVPCCCWIYMIMWKMQETQSLTKHLLYLFAISILFTAYDLFAFFYPAILIIYFRQRQWKQMIFSLPIMIIPQALIVYWLEARGATELHTENSGLYLSILKSYLHIGDPAAMLTIMSEAPTTFFYNYFDSNFLFLPLAFLLLAGYGYAIKFKFNRIEGSVLLVALLIFLFNNLAPEYENGFPMRGEWIARIYQPLFIVMIMYIARLSAHTTDLKSMPAKLFAAILVLCVCFNLAINTGGVFNSTLTQNAWYRFYQHATYHTMTDNLKIFGIRPLGFPDKTAGSESQK
jgi:hypothetical protein